MTGCLRCKLPDQGTGDLVTLMREGLVAIVCHGVSFCLLCCRTSTAPSLPSVCQHSNTLEKRRFWLSKAVPVPLYYATGTMYCKYSTNVVFGMRLGSRFLHGRLPFTTRVASWISENSCKMHLVLSGLLVSEALRVWSYDHDAGHPN